MAEGGLDSEVAQGKLCKGEDVMVVVAGPEHAVARDGANTEL